MRRISLSVVLFAMPHMAMADEPSKEIVVMEKSSIVGMWAITKAHPDRATSGAKSLLFTGDGTYAALDKDGKELWAGTFEIVRTTTPKFWDHRSEDARKLGKDQLGIYELNGDALRLACVSGEWKDNEWVGRPRPKAIDPKDADVILELSRLKHANELAHPSDQRRGSGMTIDSTKLTAEFVSTINGNDPNSFIAMFCDDAIVDDAGRIIRNQDAIQKWAAHDIFAANVMLEVMDVSRYVSGATITAKVGGTFDRTGLPNPLIMTFDVAFRSGKIAKLTCRLAGN